MSQLKNEFFAETGVEWKNSQGEPDIDYVNWLEAKVEKFTSTNTGSLQCPFLLVERFADNGAHSHWSLVNRETDEEEWSQQAGA